MCHTYSDHSSRLLFNICKYETNGLFKEHFVTFSSHVCDIQKIIFLQRNQDFSNPDFADKYGYDKPKQDSSNQTMVTALSQYEM